MSVHSYRQRYPNRKFLKLRFFLLCSLVAEAKKVTLYSRRGKPSFFSLEVDHEADVKYFRIGPQLARQGPIMLSCRQENLYTAIISIWKLEWQCLDKWVYQFSPLSNQYWLRSSQIKLKTSENESYTGIIKVKQLSYFCCHVLHKFWNGKKWIWLMNLLRYVRADSIIMCSGFLRSKCIRAKTVRN